MATLPPPPSPRPPPPLSNASKPAANSNGLAFAPPLEAPPPHSALPPLGPGEQDLYCYERLEPEGQPSCEHSAAPPPHQQLHSSTVTSGGSGKRARIVDGGVPRHQEGAEAGRASRSDDCDGSHSAPLVPCHQPLGEYFAGEHNPVDDDDDDAEVGHQLTPSQRSSLLDAVMRVCPRVVQSLPLPRERSHESSKRREQRAKARAVTLGLPGSATLPSALSQSVETPGAHSMTGSDFAAESPLDGHEQWPHPVGHQAWPTQTTREYDEPCSPRIVQTLERDDGADAETPSPRDPGDATRWLLQLSAGRG